MLRPPSSTLFPYTTLFRSLDRAQIHHSVAEPIDNRRQKNWGGSMRTSLPSRSAPDRKSTRLNSSHVKISYAVFCLKKKKPHREKEGVAAEGRLARRRPLSL